MNKRPIQGEDMVTDIRRSSEFKLLPTSGGWLVTGMGLAIGFVVFAFMEASTALVAPFTTPLAIPALHFLQGFLSCAAGIGLAGYIVSRKERDIQQHQLSERALLAEREDFLAVINHRLRNSLLANDRIIKLLGDGDFGELEPMQERVLGAILENNKEVDRLVRMLIDIYEYRNGTKPLHRMRYHIDQIVQASIDKHRASAEEKRISVFGDLNAHCELRCDRQAISDLLSHILENAIKHARSAVRVSTGQAEGKVFIAITDDGMGIAEADLLTLFDRFFVQSRDGRYAAVTGIGLCLCSQIAKAHDGKLICESKPGANTTFLLQLPQALLTEYC